MAMTVKDLRAALDGLADDMPVIIQKDGEGNSYSPLSDCDANTVYVPDSTWSGEVYSLEWTADDACMDDDEWAVMLSKPRALILAPTN